MLTKSCMCCCFVAVLHLTFKVICGGIQMFFFLNEELQLLTMIIVYGWEHKCVLCMWVSVKAYGLCGVVI